MLDSGLVGPGWISEADYYTGECKRGTWTTCCASFVTTCSTAHKT